MRLWEVEPHLLSVSNGGARAYLGVPVSDFSGEE